MSGGRTMLNMISSISNRLYRTSAKTFAISNRISLAIFLALFLLIHPAIAITAAGEEAASDLESLRGQTIDAITFSGLKFTKLFVVEREVLSKAGTPLDPELVADDLIRLQNLPIFGSVILSTARTDEGVALDFEINELPRIIPYPTVKYSEENGFSIGAGVVSPNLAGRSMKFSARALFGGRNIYGLAFKDPWVAGNHISIGLRLSHEVRQNELMDFEETDDIAQISCGTYIGEDWRLNGYAGYLGVKSNRGGVTLDPDNRDELIAVNGTLGYDSRDSWVVPRRGWQNQWLNVSYFGGDANFWTFQLDVNGYLPIKDNHSLAFGPLFTYQTGDVGEEIPPYFQYFMGGANTIRGYKLLELGKELYGKNQFLYNFEYRWNFIPMRPFKILKWKIGLGLQLAGFADAGIAWTRSQDLSLNRTRFGFGTGLRLMVPVFETIRLDLGVSQDGDVVFNFGVQSIFFGRRLRVR